MVHVSGKDQVPPRYCIQCNGLLAVLHLAIVSLVCSAGQKAPLPSGLPCQDQRLCLCTIASSIATLDGVQHAALQPNPAAHAVDAAAVVA